jgi:hypothetical protein
MVLGERAARCSVLVFVALKRVILRCGKSGSLSWISNLPLVPLPELRKRAAVTEDLALPTSGALDCTFVAWADRLGDISASALPEIVRSGRGGGCFVEN